MVLFHCMVPTLLDSALTLSKSGTWYFFHICWLVVPSKPSRDWNVRFEKDSKVFISYRCSVYVNISQYKTFFVYIQYAFFLQHLSLTDIDYTAYYSYSGGSSKVSRYWCVVGILGILGSFSVALILFISILGLYCKTL